MSLNELLKISHEVEEKNILITEERIQKNFNEIRNLIAFFREYPDLFIDFIKGPNCNFKFYMYQRHFLRAAMRHRHVYATFPRAYSKSFLSMMALFLKAIFYPGSQLFITTGGKEQAASITLAKISEIIKLIPALENELDMARGATKKSKDDLRFVFKNGSEINILAASERSRGQRRQAGLVEECVSVDQTMLNEVIIPVLNVNRRLADSTYDKDEILNKSLVYITTAGYRNSFSYSKLIETMLEAVLDPEEAMVLGGTYQIPIMEGLLDEDFVDQLKISGSYEEDSFQREYCSQWTGDTENSFFSTEQFEKHRVLQLAEDSYCAKGKRGESVPYYVIGFDVGRVNCTSEACVFRVNPAPDNNAGSVKSLVNIYSYEDMHFEEQAIALKKLYYRYKQAPLVIDANGLGHGLVDFMVKSQIDPETGETLPPFGVINDDDGEYKRFKTADTELNAMFLIKANAPINTEIYAYAQAQITSGRVKFLIDEATAKNNLLETKKGANMKPHERNEYLRPYIATTILKEQMANLVQNNDGINIILKQSSRNIKKDKVSAFLYGLYFIKKEDESKRKRKKFSIGDYMFFS